MEPSPPTRRAACGARRTAGTCPLWIGECTTRRCAWSSASSPGATPCAPATSRPRRRRSGGNGGSGICSPPSTRATVFSSVSSTPPWST
uniref:Uncharacterized protein n=1 Tax=Arundo donax TaxID=35708 RepID=A0A0A8Y7X8_ARUDO